MRKRVVPHLVSLAQVAHPQLRLEQQELMSKDGNGKCPRRDSDIELPVPVLGPTGDIILGIHDSYRNHVNRQAKLVQGETELRASTLIIQEGQDGPRKR